MRFALRDWRVIARYRGVPELNSERELRAALILQMSPAQLAEYNRLRLYLAGSILLVAAAAALVLPMPWLGWCWFFLWIFHGLRYWRIDPVTVAKWEYTRQLEEVVRQECHTIRQQRENHGGNSA